ncbi:MAG: dihydrolipoamide acetyltransferase family protein [Veillonellales bacterium]
MATEIKMPQLGLTMTEGTIGQWKKQIGDSVAEGEALVEIMTDKITSEVESNAAGILRVIAAKEGETIPVQGLLCIIGTADEKIAEPGAAAAAPAGAPAGAAAPAAKKEVKFSKAAQRMAEENGIDIQTVPGSGPEGRIVTADVEKYLLTAPKADGRVKASPLAKKIAAELGVDLTKVAGTGPEGRIVEEDVQKAAKAPATAAAPAPQAPAAKPAPAAAKTGEPLVGMRKIIAERMTASKHTAPHVTLMTEINVDATVKFRKELNANNTDVHFTYTDILTKMVAAALGHFPMVNASIVDNAVVKHEDINIGIAVALDNGLLVPVLRNADKCGLKEIHARCKENADNARSNKLSLDLLSGGTFTISNLGGYDVDGFTPVINQPESAILGVGRIIKKPVVVKDEIVIASMMTLSLSFDHRILDGAQAAKFLKCIKGYLEDPMSILL